MAKSKPAFKQEIRDKCAELEASVAALPKEERDKLSDTLVALVESMKSGSFHCICGYITPRNKGACCKCHRIMGKEIEKATPPHKGEERTEKQSMNTISKTEIRNNPDGELSAQLTHENQRDVFAAKMSQQSENKYFRLTSDVVMAIQWTGDNLDEIKELTDVAVSIMGKMSEDEPDQLVITSLRDGRDFPRIGDWIVSSPLGFHVVGDEVFKAATIPNG